MLILPYKTGKTETKLCILYNVKKYTIYRRIFWTVIEERGRITYGKKCTAKCTADSGC